MRNLAMYFAAALAVTLTACGHGSPAPTAVHDAAGCLAACPGASVVETSEDGRMCRCWSHQSGLQYTFVYPTSDEELSYSKARWQHNLGAANGCRLQGLGWEPTADGNGIACIKADEQRDPTTKALHLALGPLGSP